MSPIYPSILLVLVFGLLAHADPSAAPSPDTLKAANDVFRAAASSPSELKAAASRDLPILEKGIKDNPENSLVCSADAVCHMTLEDMKAALGPIAKAYSLKPNNPIYLTLYCGTLNHLLRPVDAYNVAKEFVKRRPDSTPASQLLVTEELEIQKYDEAVPLLQSELSEKQYLNAPMRAVVLLPLGTCYLYKGDRGKAIDTLQQAIRTLPNFATASERLGEAYLKSGNPTLAVTTFDDALRVSPKFPAALYYQGLAYEKIGKADLAQANFQKAYDSGKEYAKQNGEDFYLVYLICEKLSKHDEGEQYKQQAAQLGYTFEAPWSQ